MAKNSKQKTIEYTGARYMGILKEGKVHVRVKRTARGQNMLVGVFDPAEGFWHNDTLPLFVRHEIEDCFG